jgi:hypothetical protein
VSWHSFEGKRSDHEVLSFVDGLGLEPDLVLTTVDRSGPVAAPMISMRVVGPATGPAPDGRCVRFPGQEALVGVLTAGEIVARSAIDEVVGIGVAVPPDSAVDTRGFVRPIHQDGRLVLLVEPTVDGLQPAEIEDPHQCCGGVH